MWDDETGNMKREYENWGVYIRVNGDIAGTLLVFLGSQEKINENMKLIKTHFPSGYSVLEKVFIGNVLHIKCYMSQFKEN